MSSDPNDITEKRRFLGITGRGWGSSARLWRRWLQSSSSGAGKAEHDFAGTLLGVTAEWWE